MTARDDLIDFGFEEAKLNQLANKHNEAYQLLLQHINKVTLCFTKGISPDDFFNLLTQGGLEQTEYFFEELRAHEQTKNTIQQCINKGQALAAKKSEARLEVLGFTPEEQQALKKNASAAYEILLQNVDAMRSGLSNGIPKNDFYKLVLQGGAKQTQAFFLQSPDKQTKKALSQCIQQGILEWQNERWSHLNDKPDDQSINDDKQEEETLDMYISDEEEDDLTLSDDEEEEEEDNPPPTPQF